MQHWERGLDQYTGTGRRLACDRSGPWTAWLPAILFGIPKLMGCSFLGGRKCGRV